MALADKRWQWKNAGLFPVNGMRSRHRSLVDYLNQPHCGKSLAPSAD
jgi:hypothetical protein